ncbi:MAG: MerR family transcriptional regulator [Oscillospiraceae bacterium]|nr:MerR family transcriptional regulator [Oscillospiraceae bacterium]
MKMSVKEFAALCGVSARTLRYYDEIGLLKPAAVDKYSGYRFYDGNSLVRMQEILFYRELDFSLKSISDILSSPDYDRRKAMEEQKRLLTLKKQRLERLIEALETAETSEQGGIIMNFEAFDNSAYEAALREYAAEAKDKWGKTEAYSEYEKKSRNYSGDKQSEIISAMDGIIAEFANCLKKGETPDSKTALDLVKRWQDFITENYYKCTDEILSGLGKMYTADERFRKNIDRHGEGTADFMSRAIAAYC